ncbi:hypothetical protein FRC10_006123 [Ceratobasidium sp. 414]|nr:hypothetical protein FRC10_006123 [Ceratobasidium sp. 414]
MPTLPLGRSLLPLLEAFRGTETSMFECEPWIDPVFRHNLGLAPLSSEQDDEEEFDYDAPNSVTSSTADGFVLSSAAVSSLPPAKAKKLSGVSLLRATSFVDGYLKGRALEGVNGKRKVEWVMARLDLRNPKTVAKQGGGDNFWGDYREVVLTLLNRPGGIMSIVAEAMVRHRATPAEALRDRREEIGRHPDSSVDECDIPTPPPAQYVESTELRNEVARLVFGSCAVNSRGAINPEYRRSVSCLISRVWESLDRKLDALKTRSKRQRQQMDAQLEEAKRLKTPQSLKAAGQKLKEWRATAQQTLEYEEPKFQSREADLNEIWEEMGYVEEATKKSKRKRKGRAGGAKSTSVVPNEAEMAAAFEHYMEDYCKSLYSDPDSLVPPAPESDPIDLTEDDVDIGVDRFKDWPTEKAWANLGLPGATQFPFAEPGTGAPPRPGEAAGAKVVPKWHQIVGVIAILEGAFTKELGDRPRPTLLCDDVGLGKTLQIIGAISMLAHLQEQQRRPLEERLPPPAFTIENQTPYFAGLPVVPNLPTLIVVPRTLARQWLDQLAVFTQRGSFSLLHFSSDNKPIDQYFSDPKGDFKRAMGPNSKNASKVIVVAELSRPELKYGDSIQALSTETTRCLLPPSNNLRGQAAKLRQAEGRVPKFRAGIDVSQSIFGIKWNLLALDEAHNLRNSGLVHQACLVLAENAHVRTGATATPIFTGPKDLASQGRVLRYEPMIGENGRKLCQHMMDSQRDRTKEWEGRSGAIIEATVQEEVGRMASKSGWRDDDPRVQRAADALRQKYSTDDQKDLLRRVFIVQGAIDAVRRVMLEIVVRRTANSKDSSGNTVLDLTPFKTVVAWSPLSPAEEAAVARVNYEHLHAKELRENPRHNPAWSTKKINLLTTSCPFARYFRVPRLLAETPALMHQNFLFDQKNAGMDSRIPELRQQEIDRGLAKDTLTNKMTDDWNATNIHEKASTRVQKVGEIIDHFWDGNPKAPLYRSDGTRDQAAEEESDNPTPSERPRKFLIYVAYRLHRTLIKKFLEVKGRAFVEYDGTMTARKRDAAVHKFGTDDDCRIMLISNVGAAGLNLTAASIIILVSGVWSGQERMQIIGRVWRYGQWRDVVVVDIIAPGSIDLALAGYANGKTMMSDSFLAAGRELRRAHTIITSTAVESESEDEAEAAYDAECAIQNEPKPSKVVRRAPKRRIVDSDDEANQDEDDQLRPKPTKRARTAKKRTAPSVSQSTGEEAGAGSVIPGPSERIPTAELAEDTAVAEQGRARPGPSMQPGKVSRLRVGPWRPQDTQPIFGQVPAVLTGRERHEGTSVAIQPLQPQDQPKRRPRPKPRATSTPDPGSPAADSHRDMFDLSHTRATSRPEAAPPPDHYRVDSSPSSNRDSPVPAIPATASARLTARPPPTTGSGPTPQAVFAHPTVYSEEERQLARDLGYNLPPANPISRVPASRLGTVTHQPRAAGPAKRVVVPKPTAPKVANGTLEPARSSSSVQRANILPVSSSHPPQPPSAQPSQLTKRRSGFVPAASGTAAPPKTGNSRDRALAMKLDQQDTRVQALTRPRSPVRAAPLRLFANRASNPPGGK